MSINGLWEKLWFEIYGEGGGGARAPRFKSLFFSPLDVFIGAQQRELNPPYLCRTPFAELRSEGEKKERIIGLYFI